MKLQEAYNNLSDPIKQALYDLERYEARVSQLEAENAKLRGACEMALAYFVAIWQALNNHPASHYADYVRDLRDALGIKNE